MRHEAAADGYNRGENALRIQEICLTLVLSLLRWPIVLHSYKSCGHVFLCGNVDPFGQCGAAALPGLGPDAYMRIVASLRKSPMLFFPHSRKLSCPVQPRAPSALLAPVICAHNKLFSSAQLRQL